MIRLSLREIAEAVDGQLLGDDLYVEGSVETDSRLVKPGSLFIAKPGEVTDGHNFVAAAKDAGALAAIVQHRVDSAISQIVVEDSVVALGKLAAVVVERLHQLGRLRVIGITGSNGKTSTKNMLRAVLSRFGNTVAPIESYNNEVGAPISMLLADETTDFLVAELGADGIGSIEYLTRMCQPDVAVELKVGLAHVGEFGGIEKTFEIKSELVRFAPNSLCVFNADDPYVQQMQKFAKGEITWFGFDSSASVRAENVRVSLAGTNRGARIETEPGYFTIGKLLHLLHVRVIGVEDTECIRRKADQLRLDFKSLFNSAKLTNVR